MKPARIALIANSLVILALWLSPAGAPVRAAPHSTFTVNASSDVVDFLPGDGICETATGNGMCTLRAAIMEANALIGEDYISLPTATYQLTLSGAGEDLGALGDLDITESLIIFGEASERPVIDAEGLEDRVLDIADTAQAVSISWVTIQNGSTAGNGGAIENDAHLTLTSVNLFYNHADGKGGAAYSLGALSLQGADFFLNSAGDDGGGVFTYSDIDSSGARFTYNMSGGEGGGLYLSGASQAQMSGSYFVENNTSMNGGNLCVYGDLEMDTSFINTGDAGENGGGIYIGEGSLITLTETSLIQNNALGMGGGAYIYSGGTLHGQDLLFDMNSAENGGGAIASFHGDMTLSQSVLSSNSAPVGGGIYTDMGTFTIEASTIISNTAAVNGGGIFNSASMTLRGVTLQENRAENGGGIYNSDTLSVENSTLSGNRTRENGGGIFTSQSTYLYNVTITANMAGATSLPTGGVGGGIYEGLTAQTHTRNTILAGNHHRRLTGFIDDDCYGSLVTHDYNLVGTLSNCELIEPHGLDLIGVDPLLGELADNGGPTQTHALLEGSPAIDGGNPQGCVDVDLEPLARDQRGIARPLDGDDDGTVRCDIGAYELSRFVYLYLPLALKQ